jgi:hypothetical protein
MYRGPLTDVLIETLQTVGKPIGDAEAPTDGGWQGEPNTNGTNFVPYSTLLSGVGSSPSGPLSETSADWQLNYNLSSFGVSRTQCEWMADRARDSLSVLKNSQQVLGPVNQISSTYTIQKVSFTAIGSIQRVDMTNPAYWGQVDQFTVWVTKGV